MRCDEVVEREASTTAHSGHVTASVVRPRFRDASTVVGAEDAAGGSEQNRQAFGTDGFKMRCRPPQ